jgi:phosphatidylglycerophosphatase A
MALSTGFGLGYLPAAPGTWGTLGGVAVAWLIHPLHPFLYLLLLLAAAGMAVPMVTEVEKAMGRKDPSNIVIDELLSFPLTLFLVPFQWITVLLGFVLFRVADIAKPWPCRRLELLPGGWGMILDDTMAAIYAWAALKVILFLFPSLLAG